MFFTVRVACEFRITRVYGPDQRVRYSVWFSRSAAYKGLHLLRKFDSIIIVIQLELAITRNNTFGILDYLARTKTRSSLSADIDRLTWIDILQWWWLYSYWHLTLDQYSSHDSSTCRTSMTSTKPISSPSYEENKAESAKSLLVFKADKHRRWLKPQ